MRKVIEPQLALGQIDIAAIVFNPKSRDDIPQILRGLQHLYLDPELRQRVFAILEDVLPEWASAKGKVSPYTGRPGMALWTILVKDILRLFTPELLDRINQEVVRAGHQALKKSPEQGLNARPDSFLVETGVEYPTDTGLLYEAVRKALGLVSSWPTPTGWRQCAHYLRTLKKARRRLQKLKHSTAGTKRSSGRNPAGVPGLP